MGTRHRPGRRQLRPRLPESFGALGGTANLVFSDPAAEITVALYFLGNAGFTDRLTRDQHVINALYHDLT